MLLVHLCNDQTLCPQYLIISEVCPSRHTYSVVSRHTCSSSIVSHHRHFSRLAVLSISWLWKLALQKPEMISNCIVKFVALVPEYNHPYGQRIFGFWVLGCYWHHSVYTIFFETPDVGTRPSKLRISGFGGWLYWRWAALSGVPRIITNYSRCSAN